MAPGKRQFAERHNALLRRVDWRLLLSNPMPCVAVCSAEGHLRRAVELISDRVSTDMNVRNDCDLAVSVDPNGSALAAAHTALCPDGWLYTEWRSPFAGGPSRVREALKAAGFTDIACYWPGPSATNPRFWLPLDAPGALHHFWDSRRGGRNLIHRLGRTMRRLLWKAAWRVGLVVPVCAVGRRRAGPATESPSQGQGLLDLVRDGWSKWGLGCAPGRLSCVLLSGGNRSISKCVALIFEDPHAQPRLAIKLARVPEAVPALVKEAAVLKALHSRHPGALSMIPRVIFSGEQGKRMLLVETALTGVPLQSVVRRSNFRDLAFRATDWLTEFAQRTARKASYDWRQRVAEPAIGEFTMSFRDVADRAFLRRTLDMLATIGPLPVISEQRDFSPWNVLLDSRGSLIVLDWESAELDGLPALDLIYFVTYLALSLEDVPIDTGSQRLRESYRRLLDPATFTGGVRKACLARYAARLGLDPERLHDLAGLAWLIHSRSDFRRFAADAGGPPDQRALRRSIFLSFWEEEMRAPVRGSRAVRFNLRAIAWPC